MPDLTLEALQAVSSFIVLVSAVMFGGWKGVNLILQWAGRGKRGATVRTEDTCNAIHAAESAKITDLGKRVDDLSGQVNGLSTKVDSLSSTVEKLTSIVERLNLTVSNLNTALAVLADREGERLDDLGPRPRKRVRG